MKIALSGAANTGKTTLAKDLAKETNLPLITERFSDLPPRTLQDKAGEQLAKAFLRIKRDKSDLEQTHQAGFVSDRCTIDLFNYWISFPVLANRTETQELYNNCKNHANSYDYIVFLSWGSVVYREIEADKPQIIKSRMNPWLNLTRHSSTLGLAYSWVDPSKIIVIPKDISDRQERVGWLLSTIADRAD